MTVRDPDVSIIIVNYNTCEVTAACIDSVFQHTAGIDFEIILVDNASSDNSRERFGGDSRIRFLPQEENLGFGRANNRAAAAARGKYLLLLNSDTLLLNNAAGLFFDYAEGAVNKNEIYGGILLDRQLRPTGSYADFPTLRRWLCEALLPFTPRRKNRAGNCMTVSSSPRADGSLEVGYITGADLFLSKRLFEEFSGFDPAFFLYFEETDLERRMAAAGIARIIIDAPRIIHLEEGSKDAGKSGLAAHELRFLRSLFLYHRKHENRLKYGLFRLAFFGLRFFPVLLSTRERKREILKLLAGLS